jgi:hypothetical protein
VLAGCDKRALIPHPYELLFLTNTSLHGSSLGVIGGLGVNGPQCVRWQPSASVRSDSAQPPTFWILPTHPFSLLFTTHNDHQQQPYSTIAEPHAHRSYRDFAIKSYQYNHHSHKLQEQPLRMTIRSPVGALPRYLPSGLFLFCLLVCSLQLSYDSMCCDNRVFLSVIVSYVLPPF